jgi:hypothetical protein
LAHRYPSVLLRVLVPMVNIREVRVRVSQWLMSVGMSVGLSGIDFRWVLVLMVLVVHVAVGVGHCLMVMGMLVPLSQMKPHSRSHQSRRSHKEDSYRLAQQQQ